ncbi:replication/maintenance protein RepL [Paraburkholderia oxyphila]|uniref:replication/maintenance protein RepL n=1 Tax=Paraburkholderia oxyphila TaxID=614212 RepID=UPI000482285E|nr:replication/maintenance protein RepL [Paraburkholderia oxyphila]
MGSYFQGQRTLVDQDSGEIIDAQVVLKTVGDAGFHKIWLHEILDLVDEVGNAKMQVLLWVLSQADAQNRVFATQKEIADATNTSLKTVQRLMSSLASANVITEVRRSLWRLNPSVIFKGDHNKRMSVLIKYRNESDANEPTPNAPVADSAAKLRVVKNDEE